MKKVTKPGNGSVVFSCSDKVRRRLKKGKKKFRKLGNEKDGSRSDQCRIQYNIEEENLPKGYASVHSLIQCTLQKKLKREGNTIRKVSFLETLENATRQQYHRDFKHASRDKFFVIIPLCTDQNILVRLGNNLETRVQLRQDSAFVGNSGLVHAGSETPGTRLHFEFVPKQCQDFDNSKPEIFFEDDGSYPSLPK
jgi:hypothetical protein